MRHGETGDPDDLPQPRGSDCPKGGRCDGSGWIQVQPAYAAQRHPYPPNPELDATDEELAEHSRLVRRIDALRAQAVNSFYPCKECQPDVFYRWAGGHHAPGHTCSECIENVHRPRRRVSA